MRICLLSLRAPSLLAAGLLLAAQVVHAQPPAMTTAEYQARLAQYQAARGAYEAEATAYWDAIGEKRRERNAKRRDHFPISADDYVLTQSPIYSSPPWRDDP